MPLITTLHDSLPYIDPEPTASERASAQALITTALPSQLSPTDTHPPLPPLTLPGPASLRTSTKPTPLSAIDTTRYEALVRPTDSAAAVAPPLSSWQTTLAAAYTSQTYLGARLSALNRLDEDGKEEWLASNAHLVSMLSSLERELQAKKEAIDRTVAERRAAQEAVRGEVVGLERAWREGVGRVLEAEVAAEGLRVRVLEEMGRRGRGGE